MNPEHKLSPEQPELPAEPDSGLLPKGDPEPEKDGGNMPRLGTVLFYATAAYIVADSALTFFHGRGLTDQILYDMGRQSALSDIPLRFLALGQLALAAKAIIVRRSP